MLSIVGTEGSNSSSYCLKWFKALTIHTGTIQFNTFEEKTTIDTTTIWHHISQNDSSFHFCYHSPWPLLNLSVLKWSIIILNHNINSYLVFMSELRKRFHLIFTCSNWKHMSDNLHILADDRNLWIVNKNLNSESHIHVSSAIHIKCQYFIKANHF